MTFDPGGPDGSGPPLQKEEGDVRSTKEYIISSSSACGLHRVRANCEGSSQVFHERARSGLSLPRASPLCPRREWRVRARRNEFEASDSRCLTADDPFYRDVVPPAAGICLLPESLLLSPRHLLLLLLLLPPPGRCSSFSSSTSIAASSPPGSLKSCNKSRPARLPGASSTVELGTSGGLSREIRGRDSWKSSLGCLGDTG